MLIRVIDHVPFAATYEQGSVVYHLVLNAFRKPGIVTLSFDGISSATSSFVSAALVDLLNDFSFEMIRTRLRVVDSSR